MADELEDLARMTWGVRLITHANVDENDQRWCSLRRFMQKRYFVRDLCIAFGPALGRVSIYH
jgi:hypothetical protein